MTTIARSCPSASSAWCRSLRWRSFRRAMTARKRLTPSSRLHNLLRDLFPIIIRYSVCHRVRDDCIYCVVVFCYIEFLGNCFVKWCISDLSPVFEIDHGVTDDDFGFVFLDEFTETLNAFGFVHLEVLTAR